MQASYKQEKPTYTLHCIHIAYNNSELTCHELPAILPASPPCSPRQLDTLTKQLNPQRSGTHPGTHFEKQKPCRLPATSGAVLARTINTVVYHPPRPARSGTARHRSVLNFHPWYFVPSRACSSHGGLCRLSCLSRSRQQPSHPPDRCRAMSCKAPVPDAGLRNGQPLWTKHATDTANHNALSNTKRCDIRSLNPAGTNSWPCALLAPSRPHGSTWATPPSRCSSARSPPLGRPRASRASPTPVA